jgi:hypothetical protein
VADCFIDGGGQEAEDQGIAGKWRVDAVVVWMRVGRSRGSAACCVDAGGADRSVRRSGIEEAGRCGCSMDAHGKERRRR